MSFKAGYVQPRTEVLFDKDYARFKALIEKLDGLLSDSHLEMMAVEFALEGF